MKIRYKPSRPEPEHNDEAKTLRKYRFRMPTVHTMDTSHPTTWTSVAVNANGLRFHTTGDGHLMTAAADGTKSVVNFLHLHGSPKKPYQHFSTPMGVAFRKSSVIVVDSGLHRLVEADKTGQITVVYGGSKAGYLNGDRPGTVLFNYPTAVLVTPSDDMVVLDTANHALRFISCADDNSIVSSLAGSPYNQDDSDEETCIDGPGDVARFCYPKGICADVDGGIIVADTGNCRIRKVSPTGHVSTISGFVTPLSSSDALSVHTPVDGPLNEATFCGPQDVICDAEGRVVVLDKWCLRLIWNGRVSVLVGSILNKKGHIDSVGTYARFRNPSRITLDERGRILVLDTPSKGGYQRTTCVRVVDAGLKARAPMSLPIADQPDKPFSFEDLTLDFALDLASLSDVDVFVEDRVWKMHAWVLATNSPFFRKALTSGMSEEGRVIRIQDTRVGVFSMLASGLYRELKPNDFELTTDDDLIDLVALADRLLVVDVKKKCKDIFRISMSLENVLTRTSAVYSRRVVSLYAVVSQFFNEYYWEIKVATTHLVFACMMISVSMTLFYFTHYKPNRGGELVDRDMCVDTVIFACSCLALVLLVTSWD